MGFHSKYLKTFEVGALSLNLEGIIEPILEKNIDNKKRSDILILGWPFV